MRIVNDTTTNICTVHVSPNVLMITGPILAAICVKLDIRIKGSFLDYDTRLSTDACTMRACSEVRRGFITDILRAHKLSDSDVSKEQCAKCKKICSSFTSLSGNFKYESRSHYLTVGFYPTLPEKMKLFKGVRLLTVTVSFSDVRWKMVCK